MDERTSEFKLESTPLDVPSRSLARSVQERVHELIKGQMDLLECGHEINMTWLSYVGSEVALASECCAKMSEAKSFQGTTTAYLTWLAERLELANKDTYNLFAIRQRLMNTGAHLISTACNISDAVGGRDIEASSA